MSFESRGVLAVALCLAAGRSAVASPPPEPRSSTTVVPRALLQVDLVALAGAEVATANRDPVDGAGFRLRRARLGLDAGAGSWQARAIIELYQDGDAGRALSALPRPRPTDVYVAWQPDPALSLRAGSLRVPFTFSRQIDEGDLQLPERPRFVQDAAPTWRTGAGAWGDLGLLQYALAAFNADDDLRGTFDRGVIYAARLSTEPIGPVGLSPWLRPAADPWHPWWRVSAGVSGFYEDAVGADNYGVGGDAQLLWRRFTVAAEVLWVRQPVPGFGYYVEPGAFLWLDRLELVARFEWTNNHIDTPDPNDAWALSAGLNYLAAGKRVRLQAAYSHRQERFLPRRDDWLILRAGWVM